MTFGGSPPMTTTTGNTKSRKLSAARQIEVLKSLTPQAAAFLIGTPTSTLRDRTHKCPPMADGTYDAQDLVGFAIDNLPSIDLPDDELERATRAVEAFGAPSDIVLPTVLDVLIEGRKKHGERFGILFLNVLLAWFGRYRDVCKLDEGDESVQQLPTDDAAILKRAKEDYATSFAEARLDTPAQCTECQKIRNGTKWSKRKLKRTEVPRPDLCPDCEPAWKC